jgi:Ran GTPase-activating protein (RanGAP) involved in mRNA processing and transport
MEKTAMNFG